MTGRIGDVDPAAGLVDGCSRFRANGHGCGIARGQCKGLSETHDILHFCENCFERARGQHAPIGRYETGLKIPLISRMRNNRVCYRLFLLAEPVAVHAAVFACQPAVGDAEAVVVRGRAVAGSATGETP